MGILFSDIADYYYSLLSSGNHPNDYLLSVSLLIVCTAFISSLITLLTYSYYQGDLIRTGFDKIQLQTKNLLFITLALTTVLFSTFLLRVYLPYVNISPADYQAIDEDDIQNIIEQKEESAESLQHDVVNYVILLFALPAAISIIALIIMVYKRSNVSGRREDQGLIS